MFLLTNGWVPMGATRKVMSYLLWQGNGEKIGLHLVGWEVESNLEVVKSCPPFHDTKYFSSSDFLRKFVIFEITLESMMRYHRNHALLYYQILQVE